MSKKKGAKQKNEMRITTKNYNNKTRKGNYVIIRYKNIVGKYKDTGAPIETLAEYFYNKYVRKGKKTTYQQHTKAHKKASQGIAGYDIKTDKELSKAKKFYEKIARRPYLNSLVQPGITKETIHHAQIATPETLEEHYKAHMQGRKITGEFLKIMQKEENQKKLRRYYSITIEHYDDEGQLLMTATATGTKTPWEAIEENKKWLADNPTKKITMTSGYANLEALTNKGYNVRIKKEGISKEMKVTTEFVKP